MTAQLA